MVNTGPYIYDFKAFSNRPDVSLGTCKWVKLSIGEGPFPYIDMTLQCIIPFSAMVGLYSHMLYKVKKMPYLLQGRGAVITKRITILALAASSALIVGWLPSRVSFMLSKLNLNDANGLVHFWLVVFSFANSFVNPILYGIYSSEFRNDYKALLSKILCLRGARVSPGEEMSRTDTINCVTVCEAKDSEKADHVRESQAISA